MKRSAWLVLTAMLAAGNLSAQATVIRPEAPLDSMRAACETLCWYCGLADERRWRGRPAPTRLSPDVGGFAVVSGAGDARRLRSITSHRAAHESRAARPPTCPSRSESSAGGSCCRRWTGCTARSARCQTNFAAMSQPGQGETVRGYAYVRSEAVQAAIRKYEENLREFFTALMGINVSPAGATPRPTSG